jgi:predicted ATPase
MLEKIHVENFKASRNVEIALSRLTVLSGLNSSGKSSLLHAICILRQSYNSEGLSSGARLAGNLVHLGQFRDVLSEGAGGDSIIFTIEEDQKPYCWSFQGEPLCNQMPFERHPQELPNFISSNDFQILQADRLVPKTLYPQASQGTLDTGFLGPNGEFTVGFLAGSAKWPTSDARSFPRNAPGVSDELLDKIAPTNCLLDQVNGWLQQLSPGARINPPDLIGAADAVILQYTYLGKEKDSGSNLYRTSNVGFGLTYSLPIIVACLAARRGALLLLENPEAHLHPRGQSALGELLAQCANDGVQIIVETHSDHLLNGIRLAVKRQKLEADSVSLHFFHRQIETGDAFVESPKVLPDGKLSAWPDQFFDQWDKDLDALIA